MSQMSERRRQKFLRVIDNSPKSKMIHYMYMLDHFTRCDDILDWLISHHLTGDKFIEFVDREFDGKVLTMSSLVLKYLNREKETKPIYAGKDYQV
jgi:hypothetical protein